MKKEPNPRLGVNITAEDRALVDRLKLAVEKRIGTPVTVTQLVRMGLAALAKQEKVK